MPGKLPECLSRAGCKTKSGAGCKNLAVNCKIKKNQAALWLYASAGGLPSGRLLQSREGVDVLLKNVLLRVYALLCKPDESLKVGLSVAQPRGAQVGLGSCFARVSLGVPNLVSAFRS